MSHPVSIPDVADVELLGAGGPIDLLVEVPHGADRAAHYDALRRRLRGPLPTDLHEFFFVNTDVGAWQVGRRVAELFVAADPSRTAMVVRSLIPRTFIDCNRVEGAAAEGGLTAGIPAYVHDEEDRALLVELHRRYVALAAEAFAGLRGLALVPHTYGPVTLGIESVEDDIVDRLRWAHEPAQLATWPVRPEVDLITRTADGTLHASARLVDEVVAAYRALGVQVAENQTYAMHPVTLGYRWATAFPERVLCLELRRDLLVREWVWNRESEVDPDKVDRFAAPLADVLGGRAAAGS